MSSVGIIMILSVSDDGSRYVQGERVEGSRLRFILS